MIVADYIADFLKTKGVTDVFGVPGGVVLDFLYALDRTKDITPHLCFNEQVAGFAALGYAQAQHNLGVAYATRGPGITNMITAIADAYYDSVPVLFITAHSQNVQNDKMRIEFDQELNIIKLVKNITKYAIKIDNIDDVSKELYNAYEYAMTGRKGPVLLDISSKLWNDEVQKTNIKIQKKCNEHYETIINTIKDSIAKSKRPLILLGNGINQSNTQKNIEKFVKNNNIPVISSKISQDIIPQNSLYFGYIGSHGIREANFILSKADLIISLGNRMAFPVNSKSYSKISAQIIRIDVDSNEFERVIPNSSCYEVDLKSFMKTFENLKLKYKYENWIKVCNKLRKDLHTLDTNIVVDRISQVLKGTNPDTCIISDVGNNEFWLSKAYNITNVKNRILYSHSFGTLGSALPKSIGAYYALREKIFCFTGDQGFQFNIQDLQTISYNKLPILIVLINNKSSGMILDREKTTQKTKLLHVTYNDGYSNPNFEALVKSYGLNYYNQTNDKFKLPALLEINIDKILNLEPTLNIGTPCQNLSPLIDRETYEYLNNL